MYVLNKLVPWLLIALGGNRTAASEEFRKVLSARGDGLKASNTLTSPAKGESTREGGVPHP